MDFEALRQSGFRVGLGVGLEGTGLLTYSHSLALVMSPPPRQGH